MLRLWMLISFCTCMMVSCQQKMPAEMVALEKEVAAEPTNAKVTQLLDLYDTWLESHPEVRPARNQVLEKQLALSLQHQRYVNATSALQHLIVDYHADPKTPERILQMGELMTQMNKTVAARVLYHSFIDKYPDHGRTAELKGQYTAGLPVDTFIHALSQRIYSDSLAMINEIAARQYIDACEVYALVYHGTDKAPDYLHKASEIARTTRSIPRALSIYDWLMRAYPHHKRASQALFLKGFTYDNDLRDFEKARAVYTEFLEKYPDDEFAPSAKFLLENLGKTDDELIEALEKKAAEHQ